MHTQERCEVPETSNKETALGQDDQCIERSQVPETNQPETAQVNDWFNSYLVKKIYTYKSCYLTRISLLQAELETEEQEEAEKLTSDTEKEVPSTSTLEKSEPVPQVNDS